MNKSLAHLNLNNDENNEPCRVHRIHKLAFDDLMIYETV